MSREPDDAPAELPASERLQTLVAQLLDDAMRRGASAAEASVSASRGLNVGVRRGEIEQLVQNRDRSLAVTVYFGQRKGSASTGDWRDDAVRDTVAAACDGARFTAADPAHGLADAERLAQPQTIPDLDLYHPWAIDANAAADLARDCEAAAFAVDPRIDNSEGASVSSGVQLSWYGNSNGFSAGYPSSRHALSCVVIAADDSGGSRQRGFDYAISRDPRDVATAADAVGRRAGERTVASLGGRALDTRRAPVLFRADVARGLIGHLSSAISGSALYRKASFLRERLGQPVFGEHVTIRERPHLPRALGSAPFDAEGVATADRDLVAGGVLNGFLLGSYSARRLGMSTTGNAGGAHNLLVEPGRHDFAALLRELDRGLLVTELMGQGVNLLTGDYSRAASGFWVENGEIQYPVEELTVAGNLASMFQNIREIGRDVDARGGVRVGSLLVDGLVIAGQSDSSV